MFFCLLLFEGTVTLFFKDKKSKLSHKTAGFKFFLLFLLDDGSGSIPLTNGSGSRSKRPKNTGYKGQKRNGPDFWLPDPDQSLFCTYSHSLKFSSH